MQESCYIFENKLILKSNLSRRAVDAKNQDAPKSIVNVSVKNKNVESIVNV
jgi:hypothetical protein